MKTMVVGDIHGKFEIVEKALSYEYPVIFVGDYVDSYDRLIVEEMRSLMLVLDAIEKGKAIGLRGNHEMGYLDENLRCSGYKFTLDLHIHHTENINLLIDYVYCEGFLISHAGVSQSILNIYNISLEQYLEDKQFKDIGYSRWGTSPIGGLYWCDWRDEFKPIDSQPQIVGHTKQNNIVQKGNSYCIDVLDKTSQVLLIEDGEAEIMEI